MENSVRKTVVHKVKPHTNWCSAACRAQIRSYLITQALETHRHCKTQLSPTQNMTHGNREWLDSCLGDGDQLGDAAWRKDKKTPFRIWERKV